MKCVPAEWCSVVVGHAVYCDCYRPCGCPGQNRIANRGKTLNRYEQALDLRQTAQNIPNERRTDIISATFQLYSGSASRCHSACVCSC
eukprot:5805-Heterococcus_DN1.PRE.1